NASIYGSYFSFFYYYSLKYGSVAHVQHFLLIIVTLIIGLILGKSLYLFLNKREIKSLYITSIIGFVLATALLIVVNLIILKRFEAYGFILAMIISVVCAIGYLIFERRQIIISKKLEDFKHENIARKTIQYISQVVIPSKFDSLFNRLTNLSENKLNVTVFTGPSGIGKTSFINEFLSKKLEHVNCKMLYGDCNEIQEENEIHFEPFVQAFSKELGIKNFVNSREQISNKVSLLQPLLDSAPISLEVLGSGYTNATKTLKEHCFATAHELEKKQFKGVLVIEDLQWIDAESREFLSSFIKIVSNNSQFQKLKSNLSILLTIREMGSIEQIRGVAGVDELKADLGSQIGNVDLVEIKHNELLDYKDFIELINISGHNEIFSLADTSRYVLNNLINQKIALSKSGNEAVESEITPHYIFKLLSTMIEDKILIPSANGLILTRQITEDDLPNNDEIDKFYHSIFDKIESTPTIDRIQWIRILESAAMIGQKFDAAILSAVWGIDLLQLLDFLERMEKLGIVTDIYQEDNIYHFQSNKITAALKSYFGTSNAEVKQIVLEYNKRWINVQNKEINLLSNFNLDKLSALYRRLKIVKHVEGFENSYELVYTIYVLRIIELEDYDKLKVVFKNENSYLTKYLKAIAQYYETETVITGNEAEILIATQNSLNLITGKFEMLSTRWFIQHYVKIILGKISINEWLVFIENCKNAEEPIFIELMIRMIINSESLIQKSGTVLLEKFNNPLSGENDSILNLTILRKLLEVQILINPYCEIPKTREEIEALFTFLEAKLAKQSSFFLLAKYYEVKLNYYESEEDEDKQVSVYSESTAVLKGEGGTKFWANFILRNHPEVVLRSKKFSATMAEVETFLSERGWLDEVSDVLFKLYLLKIKYQLAIVKFHASVEENDEDWNEVEKIINEAKKLFMDDYEDKRLVRYFIDLLEQEESIQYYRENFESAAETCSKAIELSQLNMLPHRMADLLLDRSISYRRNGMLKEALEDVKTAMGIIKEIGNLPDSKVGVSLFQYGQILREAGDFKEAMKQYEQCQQYWANNISGLYRKMITEMIMVHCIYQGNLDPKEYFSMPVKSVIHKIQEFFSEPSNHSRLSSVNLKNLEELDKLKLVFK
ncbi:MAG: AAA family ATPase, partial [Bacteroidota bacterium]